VQKRDRLRLFHLSVRISLANHSFVFILGKNFRSFNVSHERTLAAGISPLRENQLLHDSESNRSSERFRKLPSALSMERKKKKKKKKRINGKQRNPKFASRRLIRAAQPALVICNSTESRTTERPKRESITKEKRIGKRTNVITFAFPEIAKFRDGTMQ